MKYGKFIVFEGVNGAGKTTLMRRLRDQFPDALYVVDPGSTEIGKELRRLLKHSPEKLERASEMLLFTATRVETTHKLVKPAVIQGKLVFGDRWYQSTIAYQSYATGESSRPIFDLNKMFDVAEPDLCIILSLPFELALERAKNKNMDKFEKREEDFLRRIYQYYETECPGLKVDASQPPSKVFEDVMQILKFGE